MGNQNYQNHRQYVVGFHIVLTSIILSAIIMSTVSLAQVYDKEQWMRGGVIPLVISIAMLVMFWYVRAFPTKVQDRAIRAEENLRHFVMTGKPHDTRLTTAQVIALRFAGDDEFIALSQRAAAEGMKPDDIKKAIKNWRADNDRC